MALLHDMNDRLTAVEAAVTAASAVSAAAADGVRRQSRTASLAIRNGCSEVDRVLPPGWFTRCAADGSPSVWDKAGLGGMVEENQLAFEGEEERVGG
jgi:hypothetical protein